MSAFPSFDEAVFYAAAPEGRLGPMSADALLSAVVSGRLSEDVPVWWPAAPDWVALQSRPELVARLADLRGAAAEPEPVPVPPAAPPVDEEELDSTFAELVRDSWRYHHLTQDTTRVDDVLLGALITATLDTGRVLIDLTSDGTNHFLRFEDLTDRSRVTMAVTHLTRDVTTARAVGQRASLVVGYGEAITSFAKVLSGMRQEAKSGYLGAAEPGIVTFDADSESQYLYAQIDLYLDLDRYIDDSLVPDYAALSKTVGATVHALRRFLAGKVSD